MSAVNIIAKIPKPSVFWWACMGGATLLVAAGITYSFIFHGGVKISTKSAKRRKPPIVNKGVVKHDISNRK